MRTYVSVLCAYIAAVQCSVCWRRHQVESVSNWRLCDAGLMVSQYSPLGYLLQRSAESALRYHSSWRWLALWSATSRSTSRCKRCSHFVLAECGIRRVYYYYYYIDLHVIHLFTGVDAKDRGCSEVKATFYWSSIMTAFWCLTSCSCTK